MRAPVRCTVREVYGSSRNYRLYLGTGTALGPTGRNLMHPPHAE